MISKLLKIVVSVILIVFFVALFSGFSPSQIKNNLINKLFSGYEKVSHDLLEIKDNISLDEEEKTEPLIKKDGNYTEGAGINPVRVFEVTNSERKNNGSVILTWNDVLAKAADTKAKDMFLKQYFAHNSPEGKTPADLVSEAGYDYIKTGENLALGVFKDEDDLVKAWMDSPGHRENILNPKFRELGVAVVSGYYKGDKVIIAVQEFGTGSYVCDKPSESDKNLLLTDYNILNELGKQITESEKALSKLDKNDPNYRSSVDFYNQIVTIYNSKIADLKSRTEIYNQKVNSYNECIDNL